MNRLVIALCVLILATIACNDATQTVNQAASTDKTWTSVYLTPKTEESSAYKWTQISKYEIKDFSVYDNGPIFGYVYFVHDDPPNHGLPGDQVLVLQLNDGTVKYFEVQDGKLMMSTGQ